MMTSSYGNIRGMISRTVRKAYDQDSNTEVKRGRIRRPKRLIGELPAAQSSHWSSGEGERTHKG